MGHIFPSEAINFSVISKILRWASKEQSEIIHTGRDKTAMSADCGKNRRSKNQDQSEHEITQGPKRTERLKINSWRLLLPQ